MSGKRYIPSNDAQFSDWADNLYTEAVKGFTKWMIAAPELFLETPLSQFQTKLAKLSDPNHGKIDKTEKDVARRVLEKACRDYVQGFLARAMTKSIKNIYSFNLVLKVKKLDTKNLSTKAKMIIMLL